MFDELQNGAIVNIIPSSTLLPKLTNVTVLGTCGYELAESFSDIAAVHANIYSTIDKDVENNVRLYNYLIYSDNNGDRCAIPDAWVDSVVVVKQLKAQFNIVLEDQETLNKIVSFLDSRAIEYSYEVS